MDVNLIFVKIKQRLNKLDSNDYDNIQCWQIVEAFNKAQRDWVRRQLHGGNMYKEGYESTTRRIDDLQILLKTVPLDVIKDNSRVFSTDVIPGDYLQYKRLDVKVKSDCQKDKMIFKSDLIEEANVNAYYSDEFLKPSLEWRETFHTIKGNKIYIYSDEKFTVSDASITYYKQPRDISINGCEDILGVNNGDINPEFKDDIVEVIIDEAVSILASDIESPNQSVSATNRLTKNN